MCFRFNQCSCWIYDFIAIYMALYSRLIKSLLPIEYWKPLQLRGHRQSWANRIKFLSHVFFSHCSFLSLLFLFWTSDAERKWFWLWWWVDGKFLMVEIGKLGFHTPRPKGKEFHTQISLWKLFHKEFIIKAKALYFIRNQLFFNTNLLAFIYMIYQR